MFDFDTIIQREHTDSLKYSAPIQGKKKDLIPLWVADMDFLVPKEVEEAISQRAKHGIYGYTEPDMDAFFPPLAQWFALRHSWQVHKEWLVQTPGVVAAIAAAISAFTKPGDGVLVTQPVYYPFTSTIQRNRRKVINSSLVVKDGKYIIDYADFEKKIVDNNISLFLLCNPHNPGGRVWTREELTTIGEICLRHNVLILSDEIHDDFIWPGNTHTVFASINESFLNNTVTCTAPTKTFNIAGLQISNIFIANPELRKKFVSAFLATGMRRINPFGIVACEAAYTYGAAWLDAVKAYIYDNILFIRNFTKLNLPELTMMQPEGTYLVWVDCSRLGLTPSALDSFMEEKAGLWLDPGYVFGKDGYGYERINAACARSLLEKALLQLKSAIKDLTIAEERNL